MPRRRISQREAHETQARLAELERIESVRRSRWTGDYPGGVNFWSLGELGADTRAALHAAQALRHYVLVKMREDRLLFYAVPMEK